MVRSTLAVLAGVVLWGVLWIPGNMAIGAIFPGYLAPGEPVTNTTVLIISLVLSVVLSVLAGFVTGAIARSNRARHGLALGVVQLAIGIFVQLGYWDLMPLWYHIPFLALLIPGNVWGATRRK